MRYVQRLDGPELANLLCPPYDVIGPEERAALVAANPDNAVTVVLPEASGGGDQYATAAAILERWVASGQYRVDPHEYLYVYEMRTADGALTRGLLGAVELRDPVDGVILPHENTMAGPESDRLAQMSATEANVEPIYLVYDGGGAASAAVAERRDAGSARPHDDAGWHHAHALGHRRPSRTLLHAPPTWPGAEH